MAAPLLARFRLAAVLGTRAYPASCGAVWGRLKRALLAGRSATRFAGSAMLKMLYAILRAYRTFHKLLSLTI